MPVAVQDSVRDITEQKRAEEALRACQLQLQQSQKLEIIGQLAAAKTTMSRPGQLLIVDSVVSHY